jgi:hypothetical protein
MWLLGFELRTFGRAVGCSYPLSHLTSPQTSILKGVFPSAYCTQADQYLFIDVVRTIPQTQPHPPSFPECMLLTANATKRSVSYLPCICLRFMLHLHDLNHEEVNGLVLFPNGQDGVHYSL